MIIINVFDYFALKIFKMSWNGYCNLIIENNEISIGYTLTYPIPFPFPCWQGKGWPARRSCGAGRG